MGERGDPTELAGAIAADELVAPIENTYPLDLDERRPPSSKRPCPGKIVLILWRAGVRI